MKTLILLALIGFAAAQIQVQIPIQRPQQPQQQWPQFPVFPQQPPAPRANWRPGQPDARCPVPDDHEGYPVFLPGTTPTTFFICWGGIAWPFSCPDNTVFRTEVNVCADPAWEPARNRFPIRPFNDEQEEDKE